MYGHFDLNCYGYLANAAGVPSYTELVNRLRTWVASLARTEAETVDVSRALSEYGIDGDEWAGLNGELEAWLGVEVPVGAFNEHTTIESIARYYDEHLDAQALDPMLAPRERDCGMLDAAQLLQEIDSLAPEQMQELLGDFAK